jgi:hypothetical protein
MSASVITKATLTAAIGAAVANVAHLPPSQAAEQAKAIVLSDPAIAKATTPISRLQSETIRGIVIAAGAPLIMALGRLAGVEIVEGDAATVVSTLISLAGAAYAWYGRETTSRPLA